MTPSGLVESVVQRRLTMIDRLVRAAESRRGITGEELDRDFDTRLIVERILTQLADLAVDINAHITSSLGETAGARQDPLSTRWRSWASSRARWQPS